MGIRTLRRWPVAIVTALLVSLACSGGTTEPPPPPPTPTITVSVDANVNVFQGQGNSVTVRVDRGGGYAGAVALAVDGLPNGVSGKFDPGVIPAGSGAGTATLTLAAHASAAVGTSSYTITATGSGVTAATATGSVSIVEPPSFSIELAPPSVTVAQGGSGAVSVSLTRRGGFTGPVALVLSGAPASVSGTFTPVSVTGLSAQLAVAVGAGTPAGTYSLLVTATGDPGSRSTSVALVVTAPEPVPSFELSVSPTSLSLQAGSSGQVAVAITRSGGFGGGVALTVTGQPAGVVASFTPQVTTGGTSTLSLTTLSSVTPATYDLLVRGTAPGLPDQVVTVRLAVTAAPGGFSLSASTAPLTIEVGRSGGRGIAVVKTGSFTGSVSLSAGNLPAGVTATLSPPTAVPAVQPNPATSTSVSVALTLAIGPSVPSGNYSVVVTGTADGQPEQSIGFPLVIVPPPGTGNTTFSFCGATEAPAWFASQDGTGTWTRVMPTVSGGTTAFAFEITVGGAAAFLTGSEFTGYAVTVFSGTRSELQAIGASLCDPGAGATRALTGSVTGLEASDVATVALGQVSEIATAGSPTFSLKGAPATAADLVAVRARQEPIGEGFQSRPLGLILRRAVNYSATIPGLAFATEAVAPLSATVTLGNLGSDVVSTDMGYVTASTTTPLAYTIEVGTTTQPTWGVPASSQLAGDLHRFTILATPAGSTDTRSHLSWFRSLGNRTITLASALAMPAVTGTAGTGLRVTGAVQPAYDDRLAVRFVQDLADGTARVWTMTVGGSRLGSATYDLMLPTLTGVAGWQAAWGLQGGVPVEWTVEAAGHSTGALIPQPAEGLVVQSASRSGTVQP